eukprot:INCI17950.2.p2 GENE.INCI17950.2~~INCI17950.2.p2  ORF type:complete len:106 (+),score=10.08 INCI17950.2:153-470(+)
MGWSTTGHRVSLAVFSTLGKALGGLKARSFFSCETVFVFVFFCPVSPYSLTSTSSFACAHCVVFALVLVKTGSGLFVSIFASAVDRYVLVAAPLDPQRNCPLNEY